jgi:dephospho-CoA kinase
MKVIGTIGMNGAGKNTVIEYISRKYGFTTITISDLIRKAAAMCELEPTRENLTQVALDQIRKYGPDYFPGEVIKIIERNRWDKVGVAGIRSFTDVQTFRKRFADGFILVFVDTPSALTRFKRIRNRLEPRDPETFGEFIEQDKKEEDNFQISKVAKEANYTLKNDKSISVLFAQIDKLIDDVGS